MAGESARKEDVQVGDEMPDGTIYAGISPDTHKPMYATPLDAPGTYTFNEAAEYSNNLDVNGHRDFHVPSEGELDVLWENRDKGKLKGTFNETGSFPAGWYWSSLPIIVSIDCIDAWAKRFSDGNPYSFYRTDDSSLRCVR